MAASKGTQRKLTANKSTGPTAGSETMDAVEFLARVASHIPDKGQFKGSVTLETEI